MAKYMCVVVGCVLLNTVSHAVPLDTILNEKTKVNTAASEDGPKLNDKPYGIAETVQDVTAQKTGQREKRFYNYFDYNNNFNYNPDFSIPFGQSINNMHPLQSFGNYGYLQSNIQKQLQEIASASWDRTYLPPPHITIPYLSFIPFIYIPKITCECTPCNVQSNNIPTSTNKPMNDNIPENRPVDNSQSPDQTVPDLPDRFPDMDDIRQNWGSPDSSSENDSGDDETEGARPISFNPVKLEEPLSKPPPPFEHGSVQVGLEPEKPNESPEAPAEPPKIADKPSNLILSSCEKAAVSCCHQAEVTYECLKSQGCVDYSFLSNACSPDVILKALRKLEYFYKQKMFEDS